MSLKIKQFREWILSPVLIAALGLMMLSFLLTLHLAAAQQSPALDQSGDEAVTYKRKHELRREWFYRQRAYPYGEIPAGAMNRAREYLKEAISTQELLAAPTPVGGNLWEQIGPAPAVSSNPLYPPTSGRIRSIAIQNSSIFYIGAASGGVWKTTNGGASWTPLTDDQPSLTMGSIAIDPWNSAVIYAGTGEYGVGPDLYGAGLLKSINSGNTWTQLPGPWDTLQGGAVIQKVVVIPGPGSSNPNDDLVLVAGNRGLFRSTQGGSDWQPGIITNLNPVLIGNISDVTVDPTNPYILYAVRNGVGIYRSTDGGVTWDADPTIPDVTPIWTPTAPCQIRRGALALAPTNTNVLYAAFETPGTDACGAGTGKGAIFRTINARAVAPIFNRLTSPTTSWCGQCGYDLALIVQPNDPDGAGPLNPENIVYVGAVRFYRSTDGGASWLDLQGVMHADVHTFAFDANDTLYVGNDGGVDMLPDPATAPDPNPAWVNLNNNLAITQFYPGGVSLHPTSVQSGDPLVLGGTQDNSTGLYRGSLQWERVGGGDGGYTAFDFNDPNNVFYISNTGMGLSILKTTDGGASFPSVGNFTGNTLNINAPVVMCPDNAQALIISNDSGVWRTNDGAGSWADNSPDFGTIWHHNPRDLAFAPGSSCNTYFAVGFRGGVTPTSNYIFRTTTGGGTAAADWDDITGNLPNRAPTDIAVHPTNANIVYVSVSGFCGSNATCPANEGHVWGTNNALITAIPPNPPNVTWTDLTGGKGLPNGPVNTIALDPANPQRLYMGTDLGVYRSLDAGTTWELFDNGLPNVVVTDLVLNNNTGVLVAATYGRSMFRLKGAIYVDASWTGCENGTVQCPYNTISEGVAAVPAGGELFIRVGTYTGPGNVPITINKVMTIRSYEGTAVIGQ